MYPLLLSDFNETLNFSTFFQKMRKYQISWKSFHWDPICSMRTDGRTDTTKLIVTFRNFANAPKKDRLASRQPLSHPKFQPRTHCVQVRISRQLTFSLLLMEVYKPCLKRQYFVTTYFCYNRKMCEVMKR
jgi:hypothetical protein